MYQLWERLEDAIRDGSNRWEQVFGGKTNLFDHFFATEEEKRAKKWWTVIGVGAMAISVATGSDVPVFVCFFAQLFKADPSKLMQVMIDKGEPARAEMDQAIADKAAGLFKNKDVGDEEAEKDGGSSSTGAKPA